MKREMKNVISFLVKLRANNNKEWFDANKAEYKAALAEFEDFTARLIDGIAGFDPSVRGLTVKDCTWRIYRDVRFSNDKTPYKTHMGAYVCEGGKKSGKAGYYFHVEPVSIGRQECSRMAPEHEGKGGRECGIEGKQECGRTEARESTVQGIYLLTSGLYMPEPEVLRSIREEISYNGEELAANIRKAKGFRLATDNTLKRPPVGFPADSPYADLLKLKDLYLEMNVDEAFMTAPDLLVNTVKAFAPTVDLVRQLNRTVDYAREVGL